MITPEQPADRDPQRPRPAAAFGDPDSNILRHYASVLRRRYLWIVLGLVVGIVGGLVSTLFVTAHHDTTTYYKATNTLISPAASSSAAASGSSTSATNVQTAAFLVHSSQVVDEVAKQTGVSDETVSTLVTATARSDVMAVDVTAISTDPAQAVKLANATATVLNKYVVLQEQQQFTQQRDTLEGQLNTLQQQQTDLEAKLTQPGANPDIINAQISSVVNQYRLVYDQFSQLATQSTPAPPMSTLQAATPVQINQRAYAYRLGQNENARGQVSGSTATPPAFDETDLSTAPPVSKKLRVVIGAFAGLLMGIVTAFLVEAWDDRIRRRDLVESLTGFPVIAEIPKLSRKQARDHDIPAIDAPGSRAAERYRAARTSILFSLDQHLATKEPESVGGAARARVVMVTSPNPSEGKTTTVASLAAAFGDNGMRTLVIDCDFRKPAIGRYLAPTPNLYDPTEPNDTRLDGVWFLPAPHDTEGPGDAVTRLRQVVVDHRDKFDILVLDTPPMLTTNDASDLLAAADAVVLVLRSGQTRRGAAQRVSTILSRFRAEVLGVVLNGCDDVEMDTYYGYGYGYGEPSAPIRHDADAPVPAPNPTNGAAPAATVIDTEPASPPPPSSGPSPSSPAQPSSSPAAPPPPPRA